jgi:hypothetical protein
MHNSSDKTDYDEDKKLHKIEINNNFKIDNREINKKNKQILALFQKIC